MPRSDLCTGRSRHSRSTEHLPTMKRHISGSDPVSSTGATTLATFTLADLRGATLRVGDLTISRITNDASTISPQQILVDTIEGADLGLRFRVADGVATTASATQTIGIDFEVRGPAFILEGARWTWTASASPPPTRAASAQSACHSSARSPTSGSTSSPTTSRAASTPWTVPTSSPAARCNGSGSSTT